MDHQRHLKINSNVIENYIQLFSLHEDIFRSKPIFVTTIPRSWRKYSWLIQEDGMIVRKDQEYRKGYSNSYHGFPGGEQALVGSTPLEHPTQRYTRDSLGPWSDWPVPRSCQSN